MAYNNSINNTIYGTFTVGNMTIAPGTGKVTISEVSSLLGDLNATYGKLTFDRHSSDTIITNNVYIENTSTDASSDVRFSSVLGAGASGDVALRIGRNFGGLTPYFMVGIDNSETGDPLVFAHGSSLASNIDLKIHNTGEVLKPKTPAFFSYLYSTQSNVTGNGTVYKIICNTENFDQGGNYNTTTGEFISPHSYKYLFICSVTFTGILSATLGEIRLVTSNKTYYLMKARPSVMVASNTKYLTFTGSVVVDMDAADTAYFDIKLSGEASDVIDIIGSDWLTTFSGYMVA